MRFRFVFGVAALLCIPPAFAQKHEIGLTLGHVSALPKSAPTGTLNIGGGPSFQASYGYRLRGGSRAELWGEGVFMASPLQEVASATNPTATRDFASLYALPGLRVKFAPRGRVSPFAAFGAGYGLFEHSVSRIDGGGNQAPRFIHRGALAFGGGLGVRIWRFVGARWEVRDFYSGNPAFNVPVSSSGLHNVVAGGGIVLQLGAAER